MSTPAPIPTPALISPAILPAILHTILGRLALLFLTGAGGDPAAAHNAAARMLAAYDPETEDEVRLAAQIISFSFHALEALNQAAGPDMPLNHKLRLRGGAVSLSRASHRAERRLDQLQKARRLESPVEPAAAPSHAALPHAPDPVTPEPNLAPTARLQPADPAPAVEKALDLITATRDAMTTAKATGQTWTQAFQQRQRAKRMTENLKKNQARHAARTAAAKPCLPDQAPRTSPDAP